VLTDEELSAIETRIANASPSPWEAFVEPRDFEGGDSVVRIRGPHSDEPDLYLRQYRAGRMIEASPADHDFVANARQDVPRLVEEVRRLQRLLQTHPTPTLD
jgi:hypothetical protein